MRAAASLKSDASLSPSAVLTGMVVLSVVIHAVTFWVLPKERAATANTTIIEMVDYKPPEPPPPPPPKEEPPKPEPPKAKPPPVKVATVKPPPPPDTPPPPNDEPPPEPSAKPPPLVVGISMSSTSTSGTFAVGVGNTTYGKADKVVPPEQVKAYAAPKYAPPGTADVDPEVEREFKGEYPTEARKNDIEGVVVLRVTVDASGAVSEVKILKGPGYGLNEAAREWILKTRFKPAMKNGEPVATTITYNYRFEFE
jgi:periplasmic protein TonB